MRTRLAVILAALLAMPATSLAQGAGASPRGWFDLNVGTASSVADATTFQFPYTIFLEPASLSATYPTPSRARFLDVGGGALFSRRIGLGLSIVRTASADVADLAVSLPHPFFFNAFGEATSPTTQTLSRRELAANLHAMVVAVESGGLQLRVFGGPSFIFYGADMVQDIQLVQDAGFTPAENVVAIRGEHVERASAFTSGLHAGAEVAYFFTRAVGIGGGLRVVRGTVTLNPEPLSEVSQDVRVGGTQIFAGVRFRFGERY